MDCNEIIIKRRWSILHKIGEGSFGQVFKAQDIKSNELYAIKREPSNSPYLYHEYKMYRTLRNGPSIPKCYWFGQHDGFHCLTIDLLGPSLKDLQDRIKIIPFETIVQLGCQLIASFKYMHNVGIVYRDLKPENLLLSKDQSFSSPHFSLNIIDFGLAAWWKSPSTQKPYPPSRHRQKIGTARYASIPVHHGHSHAPRDDLESLGYLLLDLMLCGQLPWSGVVARSCKAGWDRIKRIKENTQLYELCTGLPSGLLQFISYTRSLQFNDRPDYDYLTLLLKGALPSGPYSAPVKRVKHSQPSQAFFMQELAKALPSSPSTYHHKSDYQNFMVCTSPQGELV
ncbi:kinase-like domain-containing protein [Sporodiniella umbellata]|nr:kinase-like domain-containing protein [Sporodiniella umbellata]